MPTQPKIKNSESLATSVGRRAILEIAEAGLQAIDTGRVMREKAAELDLSRFKRIFVVGVGKCSLEAGAVLEEMLGDKITGGIIIDVHGGMLSKIKTFIGTHPYPSQANVDATKEIIEMLGGLTDDDAVIFLISGGGSTLLCQPNNITCLDEGKIIERLFEAGADIYDINTIRKHLSFARGGYLAKYAYPAYVYSFIFSDVPGDDIEFIASGPTVKDSTTVDHAIKLLSKYCIEEKCGFSPGNLIETPKDDKYFDRVTNILAVSNMLALKAMEEKAKDLGLDAKIATNKLMGDAVEAGSKIVSELNAEPAKTVLLYGGETTVKVVGKGAGGRNQELVLSALKTLNDGEVIVSISSDGRDNGIYAGALADTRAQKRAVDLGLNADNFLANNDSQTFFEKIDSNILTGDTGSNVSDLMIGLKT